MDEAGFDRYDRTAHGRFARDLPETMPRFAMRTYVSPRGLSQSTCGNVVEQTVRRRGSR
jgi:hypothetical protein